MALTTLPLLRGDQRDEYTLREGFGAEDDLSPREAVSSQAELPRTRTPPSPNDAASHAVPALWSLKTTCGALVLMLVLV